MLKAYTIWATVAFLILAAVLALVSRSLWFIYLIGSGVVMLAVVGVPVFVLLRLLWKAGTRLGK